MPKIIKGNTLDKTLKEELVFSTLMTIGMVTIMLSFNTIREAGLNSASLLHIAANFIPVFIIAFTIEQLIVSHNARKVHKVVISPEDAGFKSIVVFTALMVIGMSISMTLYMTLVNIGTSEFFWQQYFTALSRNFPVALIAQLVVVGPIARLIHMRLFKKVHQKTVLTQADREIVPAV